MVRLSELLNDFNDFTPPEERDEGQHKSFEIVSQGKKFEFQYMEMPMPLQACLQFAPPEQKRELSRGFGQQRRCLNFQFYYVDENGEKTQEDQNHENGVIFGLIKDIGGFLNHKIQGGVDTLLFGGDTGTRERIYDLFARRITREGWTLAKGQGRGPTGRPGTFYALFRKGS